MEAPKFLFGIDFIDGKFFVAKKSVFNMDPKLYKSIAEIDADNLSAALNSKFKVAFEEFSKLGIRDVLQGDLMFTDDVSTETIDGKSFYTFQPNTIVYAVDVNSDFGKKIKNAKIGVVWHTTYKGKSLPDMKASFGANISGLQSPSTVWMDDATYKDVSGKATMTDSETAAVTSSLSAAGSTFRKINSSLLSNFLNLQNTFTGNLSGASLKTYNNSKVRKGETITNPKSHAQGYLKWVDDAFQKQIDKLKTPKNKEALEVKKKETIRELKKHTTNLTNIITFQNHIVDAKMGVVKETKYCKEHWNFHQNIQWVQSCKPRRLCCN